jgi:hypothetical protein
VHLGGEGVGEAEQGERRLVGEDAGALRPEPDRRQILMLARGEVDESLDPAPDPAHPACSQVLLEELRGVTGLCRLRGGEEPLLRGGDLEEAVPIRSPAARSSHAKK